MPPVVLTSEGVRVRARCTVLALRVRRVLPVMGLSVGVGVGAWAGVGGCVGVRGRAHRRARVASLSRCVGVGGQVGGRAGVRGRGRVDVLPRRHAAAGMRAWARAGEGAWGERACRARVPVCGRVGGRVVCPCVGRAGGRVRAGVLPRRHAARCVGVRAWARAGEGARGERVCRARVWAGEGGRIVPVCPCVGACWRARAGGRVMPVCGLMRVSPRRCCVRTRLPLRSANRKISKKEKKRRLTMWGVDIQERGIGSVEI
jgi:hypothetical protein